MASVVRNLSNNLPSNAVIGLILFQFQRWDLFTSLFYTFLTINVYHIFTIWGRKSNTSSTRRILKSKPRGGNQEVLKYRGEVIKSRSSSYTPAQTLKARQFQADQIFTQDITGLRRTKEAFHSAVFVEVTTANESWTDQHLQKRGNYGKDNWEKKKSPTKKHETKRGISGSKLIKYWAHSEYKI